MVLFINSTNHAHGVQICHIHRDKGKRWKKLPKWFSSTIKLKIEKILTALLPQILIILSKCSSLQQTEWPPEIKTIIFWTTGSNSEYFHPNVPHNDKAPYQDCGPAQLNKMATRDKNRKLIKPHKFVIPKVIIYLLFITCYGAHTEGYVMVTWMTSLKKLKCTIMDAYIGQYGFRQLLVWNHK